MKKIIIINYEHFHAKFKKQYFIKSLIDNQIIVEYWDLTKLYHSVLDASKKTENYIRHLSTFKELETAIKNNSNTDTLFIPLITYGGKGIRLYRYLSKYNSHIGFFYQGIFPRVKTSFIKRVIVNIKSFANLRNMILNKISALLKKIKYIKDYDVVFTAGYLARNISHKSKNVPINYFDYDHYINVAANSSLLFDHDYCVYLDDNAVFHPDLKLLGIKNIDTISHYYYLNNFFSKIEGKYNVRVIIAAHPTSKYTSSTFNNREVIQFRTCELVKNAQFVIATASTSISFAVLFNKPIIFIYTQELLKKYAKINYAQTAFTLAKRLGCNLYDISNKLKLYDYEYADVNYEKYENFKYEFYTTPEVENMKSQDIFLNFLKNE